VHPSQPEPRKADVAERVITGALRTATSVRFGGEDKPEGEGPGDDGSSGGAEPEAGETGDETEPPNRQGG
jgi:hypothetical protein